MNVLKLFLVFFVVIKLADINCFPTKNEKDGTSLRHKKKSSEKRGKLNHKLFKEHHKRPKRHPHPTDFRHHETLKCLRQYLNSQRKRTSVHRPYLQTEVRYWPHYPQKSEWNSDRRDENQQLSSVVPNFKYSVEAEAFLPEKNKKEKSHNHVYKIHHDHEKIHKHVESTRNKTNAHIAAVRDRTNNRIAAVRNKTNSHIAAVRNITNSQIAAVRNATKVKIDAVRNRTNAHIDAKKNYLQNKLNKVPQIQVHVEAGIKHNSGNHGVALDVSNNGVKIETGPIINENSQRRSGLIMDSTFQSTESQKDILATISPETTPTAKLQDQTEESVVKIEEASEGLRTWNVFRPVIEEGVRNRSEIFGETSTLAVGFHSLNISKPSANNDYEVHEAVEENNNYLLRDDFATEKILVDDEKKSTDGLVRNGVEEDSVPEVSTEESMNDDLRNAPEESAKKVTIAAMINDEMLEADVESKLNFDSKKQISSTEFVEKLLEKLYTTPADDYAAVVWEPEKINNDDNLKSIVEDESDLKSETTELPVESREDPKLGTTESEKYLREYAVDDKTTNGEIVEPKLVEEEAYTTETFQRSMEPTEYFYKEGLAERNIEEASTSSPEMKMVDTSEAFRSEEWTTIVEQQRNLEETTAGTYDESEQDLKRERKLHHQQNLESNDISDQYFLITEGGDFTPFTEKAVELHFVDSLTTERQIPNGNVEDYATQKSSNDETNHIFYIDQNGKNLTSLSQTRSESSTEKRRSDILITDEYNELQDAHEDDSSSFTNLTIFSLNPNDNQTGTYQEPPDTFSPESLLQLIPVIIHELRANKSVNPEDMKVFSDLYGKLWPAIEQISKNPEFNITQLLNIKNEEDLQNLMSLFAKLQEMEENKNEDLESAETSSQAFSTIRYEEPSLYDYVDDHQEESYEPPEEVIDDEEEILKHEKEISEFNARNMDTDDFGDFQDNYNDYVAEESLPETFSDPQIDYELNEDLREGLEENNPSVLELYQTAQAHDSFKNVRLPSYKANYPFSEDDDDLNL